MTELEKLKKRLQELEKREQAVDTKENLMVSLLPAYNRVSTELKESASNNSIEIVKNVLKENNGTSAIIKAIEKQTSALEDENSKEVLGELKNLFKSVQKLEKKNYFDQKELNVVFHDGIEKISNILIGRDLIPNETTYNRKNGKITTITEKYDNFTLIYNWTYDNHGGLIKVTTKRKDAT